MYSSRRNKISRKFLVPDQKQEQLPAVLADFGGHFHGRGSIKLKTIPKPPKRRFNPGNILEIKKENGDLHPGERYVVQYCFRMADEPSEWIYSLGLIEPDREDDGMRGFFELIGAGEMTPRVVSEGGFTQQTDVHAYFMDIMHARVNIQVRNKDLMSAGAGVVTEIVMPEFSALPEASQEAGVIESTAVGIETSPSQAVSIPQVEMPEWIFTCIDCGQRYPIGIDVEADMYLHSADNAAFGGKRCVYCYNNKVHYTLDVERQWHEAYRIKELFEERLAKQRKSCWEQLTYWQTQEYVALRMIEDDNVDGLKLLEQACYWEEIYANQIMMLCFNA